MQEAGGVPKVLNETRSKAFVVNQCLRYHSQSQGGHIAEFPPKRIRNTSAKVLESRRTGLEHYIQSLAKIVPTPPQLITFLELPVSSGDTESCTGQVFGFKEDPFIRGPRDNSTLSDMITQGEL